MEGEGFRDRTPEFERRGVALYGVSTDRPEDNRAWAEKMEFEFRLLSDTSGEAVRAWDAERAPDDRWHSLPRRITYLIDPEGIIRRAWTVERDAIDSHPEDVLAAVTDLMARGPGTD